VQYQQFKTFSPDLLGYGARSMLKAARQFHADLTIVHSEAGLWVGNQLLSEGYRVGVDFEDWFSEDLLPDARAARPVAQLKQMERRLARECCYCLTTSHALAHALAHAYDAPKPTVIYNVFPWAEQEQIDHLTKDRKNLSLPSLHWFSQTIGPGRGLETLFQALSFLTTPAEIHLRGNYSDSARQWLEPLVPDEWHQHLFIHPTVSNAELLSRIAEHDIGLALEDNQIPSRNLTVTNKLFQYLQAGLAVVATDTAGQREVLFKSPQNSTLILSDDALLLAKKLEYLLQNPTQLKLAQEASLQLAKDMFCWDKQCAFLLQAVSLAIDPK
jgi:glycosyltransferase involved in cell wall biosynthesis